MKIRTYLRVVGWLLLFPMSAHVSAQCGSSIGNWPSEVSFDPAAPASGDLVNLVLGPSASVGVDPVTISMIGNDIIVEGAFFDPYGVGIPPPPRLTIIPLGPLEAGDHVVHIRLTDEQQIPCPEITTALVVGGGGPAPATGVPAGGVPAWLLLALGFIGIAWQARWRAKAQ